MLIGTIIFIVLAVIIVAILGFILFITWLKKRDAKRSEWDVLNFMAKYPDLASFYFIKNNDVLAEQSANEVMPLASTVKIIIAMEYAKQAARGSIPKDQPVALADLESYYIPGTDGGAHESWLKVIKDQGVIQHDKVPLHDVAKGMIHFSSNANTEFLLDLLGLKQINGIVEALGMDKHEEIYFFTSSFLISPYLHIEESMSKRKVKRKMKEMSMEDYKAYAGIIHGLLKQGRADDLIEKATKTNMIDFEVQRITSNRLPGATVKEYATIMNNIQNGATLDDTALTLLKDLLERDVNAKHKHLSHFGSKGGSTLFVHNHMLYVTVNEKDNYVLGGFVNDPKNVETAWIHQKMERFVLRTLTDQSFQDKVVERLSGK